MIYEGKKNKSKELANVQLLFLQFKRLPIIKLGQWCLSVRNRKLVSMKWEKKASLAYVQFDHALKCFSCVAPVPSLFHLSLPFYSNKETAGSVKSDYKLTDTFDKTRYLLVIAYKWTARRLANHFVKLLFCKVFFPQLNWITWCIHSKAVLQKT